MEDKSYIDKINSALSGNNRYIKTIGTIAVVVTSIVAIGAGYNWYVSNVYKPKVKINSVDFENAVADIQIKGIWGGYKQKFVYGNATIAAGGEWGVRFGTTNSGVNDDLSYNTVELTKNDLVYEILRIH